MSRAILILVCLVLFLALTALGSAGGLISFYTTMSGQGLVAVAWLVVAGMLGSVIVRYTVGPLPGLMGIVTSAATGLGAISLLTLGLGLAGWLNQWVAWGMGLGAIGAFVSELLIRKGNPSLENTRTAMEQWLAAKPASTLPWLVVAVFGAIAVAAATLPPGYLWPGDPFPYDVLEYHLQVPREWYEAGRITPLHHNAYCFFPANLEMHYLLAMHLCGGAWKAMYLAHYLTLGHMALTIGTVYAILRHLLPGSRAASAAALAAAAMAMTPWTVSLATVAYNESALLLYGTLAFGWAMIAVTDPRPIRCLAIGGILAGLACGAKYTGLPMVLLPAPLVFGVVLIAKGLFKNNAAHLSLAPVTRGEGRVRGFLQRCLSTSPNCIDPGWRPTLAAMAIWLLCGLAVFAPWLWRNRVWTGNPVFPEALSVMGPGTFTPAQVQRWEKAHAPAEAERSPGARLKAAANRIVLDGRFGYLIWPLGIAGLIVGRRDKWVWLAGGMLGLMVVFWLGFTHLQSRFFVLALPLAALLIGRLALSTAGWWITGTALVPLAICSALGSPASWEAPSSIASEAFDGWSGLCRIVYPTLREFAKADVFGLDDLSIGMPDDIHRLIKDGQPIALAGEAQAFRFATPPGKLVYRTVFDIIPPTGDATALDAWLGPDAAKIRASHYVILFPAELRRLSKYYANVPLPPQANYINQPTILPPQRNQSVATDKHG